LSRRHVIPTSFSLVAWQMGTFIRQTVTLVSPAPSALTTHLHPAIVAFHAVQEPCVTFSFRFALSPK
jgi:hypothetical protein